MNRSRLMASALAVTASLIFHLPLFSQSRETVTQSTEWFSVVSNIKVSKKFSVLAEGQFRFSGNFQPMQFQIRTGVDYSINKHFSTLVGYVYSWNSIYGLQPATFANNEHRLFEQVVFKHHAGRFALNHRLRLEQRYIEVHVNSNGDIINNGYDLYQNRIRYKIQGNYPINHESMLPKTFYASFYEELFMDFGSSVVYKEPDQNRVFIGLGYQLTEKVSFQGGFLYQLLIKSGGLKQENNVGFQLQLNYNIDLTKAN